MGPLELAVYALPVFCPPQARQIISRVFGYDPKLEKPASDKLSGGRSAWSSLRRRSGDEDAEEGLLAEQILCACVRQRAVRG
jgi:hypothetical protein